MIEKFKGGSKGSKGSKVQKIQIDFFEPCAYADRIAMAEDFAQSFELLNSTAFEPVFNPG